MMPLTRRGVLAASAAAGAAATLGGCERLISKAAARLGEDVPEHLAAPASPEIDPVHHLLSRAGYGPWPGDVEAVRSTGTAAWIERQLHPESIEDHVCNLRARRFVELEQAAGECFEYDKPILREEIARHALLRAVYSKRQLLEVMVSFWTDHLNINIEKGDCIYLKPADDREVVRRHALGRFVDLIRASATSAAMLVYLDGNQNARGVPNENYGRELLELHTLGVDGGYTQQDVYEAARCLTGWRVRPRFRRGTVYFDAALHDDGPKTVLNQRISAGGGAGDVDALVNILCAHLSTARHIATKLVRRFVSEDAPALLVQRVADVFRSTGGDIRAMLRTILNSDECAASRGGKFKPPFRFVVSALRAVGADTHAHAPLIEYLARMGEGVFEYPTPDGYPDDRAAPWMGTLLWRWNFAFALAAGQVPTVVAPVDRVATALGTTAADARAVTLFRYLAGRLPTSDEARTLRAATEHLSTPAEQVGLLLASPQFQRF